MNNLSIVLPLLGHSSILIALKRLKMIFHENDLCTTEIQCHVSPHTQLQGENSITIFKHDWQKRTLFILHTYTLFAQWLQKNKESPCLVETFKLIYLSCLFHIFFLTCSGMQRHWVISTGLRTICEQFPYRKFEHMFLGVQLTVTRRK